MNSHPTLGVNSMNDMKRVEPEFLDTEGPSADIPLHVSTTNVWVRFGLREGESVSEAMARSETARGARVIRDDD